MEFRQLLKQAQPVRLDRISKLVKFDNSATNSIQKEIHLTPAEVDTKFKDRVGILKDIKIFISLWVPDDDDWKSNELILPDCL